MSAPTTAVRETAALCDDPAVRAIQVPLSLEPVIAAAVRVGASIYARDHALPVAEHRDALAAALGVVVERIGRAVERLGLGDAADCSVDDPDLGYLTAIEDLHNATASARLSRDALAAEVAQLEARLECGASPYGVHRCVHCDSEVT